MKFGTVIDHGLAGTICHGFIVWRMEEQYRGVRARGWMEVGGFHPGDG